MSVLDTIGSLRERLEERLGRRFGRCYSCGKPTRSHSTPHGVECHACHSSQLIADGGRPAPGGECTGCGATEGLEKLGDACICQDCIEDGDTDDTEVMDGEFSHDHENEYDIRDVDDEWRADQLEALYERLNEFTNARLRLMPLGEDGKEPAITGDTGLWSHTAYSKSDSPLKAVQALRNGEERGYAVYAGMAEYGTEKLVVIDVDEPEEFPFEDFPDTLKVVSGSGRGVHLYFWTTDDIANAFGKDQLGGVGEVKAENWFVICPGSIHPTGGMYHIQQDVEIAELAEDDLPDGLKPRESDTDWDDIDDADFEDLDTDTQGGLTTKDGLSLDHIRDRDDKLDDLLTSLEPAGYSYPSASEADYAAAGKLYFWGFSKPDIVRIMRQYRARPKTIERDDYIQTTVERAAGGERYDPTSEERGDDYNPGYTGVLPAAARYLGTGELRRYAEKRGIGWPTADELYDELEDELKGMMEAKARGVLNAPTGIGKTNAASTIPWRQHDDVTDGKPVVIFHSTTEARDQAAAMSRDALGDANVKVLHGRKETCPVAAGDQDPGNEHHHPEIEMDGMAVSNWIDVQADILGRSYSNLHQYIGEESNIPLICEQGDGKCRSKEIFEDVPRDDSGNPTYDVIHATKPFAHVPSLRMRTHMIFDEKPDYGLGLYNNPEMKDVYRRSVNEYLDWLDIPIDTYHDLVNANQRDLAPGRQQVLDGENSIAAKLTDNEVVAKFARYANSEPLLSALDWQTAINYAYGSEEDADDYTAQEAIDATEELTDYQLAQAVDIHDLVTEALKQSPPPGWFRSHSDVHANANGFARAIWEAEERAGGRHSARVSHEPPRLDANAHDVDAWNREQVNIVFNDDMDPVQGWVVPDTTLATSVIGLDAHAQRGDPGWQVSLLPGIATEELVTGEERARYRRYERGLHVVQVGDAVHPVAGGKYIDGGQGKSFRAMIHRLREEYGDDFRSVISSKDAVDHLEACLEDEGEDDVQSMYYGIEESNNDFAGERVGYVAGSIDPGDEPVLNTIAALGLDAEPVTSECEHCAGDGCEQCNHDGYHREHGRTFTGRDADAAQRVLKGVREHHVHQSIGRWSRDARSPDEQAVVYVHTTAVADHMVDAHIPGPIWTTTDTQADVLEILDDAEGSLTAQEIADEAGCTREAVRQTLTNDYVEDSVVRHPGEGRYGADLFEATPELNSAGAVTTGGVEVPHLQDTRYDSHTWNLEIDACFTSGTDLVGAASPPGSVQTPIGVVRGRPQPGE